MVNVTIWDNDGQTYDRYTIFIEQEDDEDDSGDSYHSGVFGMSDNPLWYQGYDQYCGDFYPDMGGDEMKAFEAIPHEVQLAIIIRAFDLDSRDDAEKYLKAVTINPHSEEMGAGMVLKHEMYIELN